MANLTPTNDLVDICNHAFSDTPHLIEIPKDGLIIRPGYDITDSTYQDISEVYFALTSKEKGMPGLNWRSATSMLREVFGFGFVETSLELVQRITEDLESSGTLNVPGLAKSKLLEEAYARNEERDRLRSIVKAYGVPENFFTVNCLDVEEFVRNNVRSLGIPNFIKSITPHLKLEGGELVAYGGHFLKAGKNVITEKNDVLFIDGEKAEKETYIRLLGMEEYSLELVA